MSWHHVCRVSRRFSAGLIVAAVALSTSPAAGELAYGVAESLSGPQRLVSFDTANPAAILTNVALTGDVGEFESMAGLDFRPGDGRLYAISGSDRLFTVNPATGVANLVAPVAVASGNLLVSGFDFTPDGSSIRYVRQVSFAPESNQRINPVTGAVITDGSVDYPAGDPRAGTLFASGLAYAPDGRAYLIDPRPASEPNSVLLELTDPVAGTAAVVGNFGVGFGNGRLGFDISNTTGVAYAALGTLLGNDKLYTINLSTGAATFVGNLGTIPQDTFTNLRGVAVVVPEPATLGLVAAIPLALAMRRAGGRRRRS